MTPEYLCLLYMFPCAEIRKDRGALSDKSYTKLYHYIVEKSKPSRTLLKRSFPNAWCGIRTLAKQHGRDPWSWENIFDYWHVAHNTPERQPPCRTAKVRITQVLCDGKVAHVTQDTDRESARMINVYDLPIHCGEWYYTHQNCIIEKIHLNET